MKIPEPLFKIINIIVKLLLKSPFHFLASNSLMIIHFKGKKSGRQYSTPVRYLESDNTIIFFTSDHGKWWRNIQGGADIELTIKGNTSKYHAQVLQRNSIEVRDKLINFLNHFPQDAVYHEIRIDKDKTINMQDLDKALNHAIAVEAKRFN